VAPDEEMVKCVSSWAHLLLERSVATMETTPALEQSVGSKQGYASWPDSRQAPDDIIASSGIAFHVWRLYQHFWLLCLLFPLASLVRTPGSPAHVTLGVAALVVFAAGYTWLMWPHPVSRSAGNRNQLYRRLTVFVILVALALVLSVTDGLAFLWLFIGVSACAGAIFPTISAFVVISLLMLVPVVLSLILEGGVQGVDWPLTIALLLLVRGLGLDMIGVARMGNAIRALHTARRDLARLAVAEERVRMARDLHDVLGHTLSMMALKSELAWRTMEQEPVQAVREMQDVEKAARQVLREVRTAVAGFRQPTLQSEVEGACQLLEAAGIEYHMERALGEVPSTIDIVLAWVVREGVTNVVRHSRARHCSVCLTETPGWVRLVITNDDRRSPLPPIQQVSSPSGNGLSGMVERVVAQGGRIEAGPRLADGESGFRVQVELPLMGHHEKGAERVSANVPTQKGSAQ
jgi:two-component system sensor histidine kinase DesK